MRSSRQTHVAVKVDELGGAENWLAISLLPPKINEQSPQVIEQQRWEALHMLSLAAQQQHLPACYRQVLQAGTLLTGAAYLALYLPAPGSTLQREAELGTGFEFSQLLSSADLGPLRTPRIWQPGRQLETSLYKLAHAAKLSYTASTPLDVTNPSSGLLVAAHPDGLPPADLLTMLQILAATIETARLHAQVTMAMQADIRRLTQSEAIGEVLQTQVQDGVLFVDQDLMVLEINPAAENMLGYTSAEVHGRAANDVLVSSQSLMPAMELALAQQSSIAIGERKLHRRDGSEFLASLRVAAVASGEDTHSVAVIFTDLSEHEAFHLQAQQLQQRAWLGEITAYFAHEVRNPINNISTGLQLMQISLPEQDPMQEQITRLLDDCDRLDHRMKSVLNFSRNIEHNPQPMDIAEFSQAQLDRWRPRMVRKNIKDHLQVSPDTPPVLGDRRALDQVFTNLITNAIQALEGQPDGMLAVKIGPNAEDPNMVDVFVSDNGPGIPEELQERIFEPFFTTKQNEGTGLGLPISRRILLMHKGEIQLVESFPGGTLFKISLPSSPETTKEGTSAE